MNRCRWMHGVLLAGITGLIFTGCSSWILREDAGPFPEATREEILNGLDQRSRGVLSLKALVSIRLMGQEQLTARVVWQKPQQLRFSAFDSLGRTMFELVVADGFVEWGAPGRSPVSLGALERLEGAAENMTGALPVEVEDLVRILEAIAGPALKVEERFMLEQPPGPFYWVSAVVVEEDAARLTKRFWVERRGLRITRQEFFQSDGAMDLALEFSDYPTKGEGDWPHRVTVLKPKNNRKVVAVFKELKFNLPLAPEEFRLVQGTIP